MTDEIYTDPLGRSFHVLKGSEFNKMFGGIGGRVYDDDEQIFLKRTEPDDKLEFPSSPHLDDYHHIVSSGRVLHNVERERAYGPHQPVKLIETDEGIRIEGTKGFAATELDIFREDDWFGECWQVMEAHGWHRAGGGLGYHIIDQFRDEFGACAITKAKLEFGENWEGRIAELASTRLVQPLSRLWYAINMLALYYCHRDEFRLGFLWAEYRMRMHVEKDAVRGENVVKSAKNGGIARGASKKAASQKIIKAMQSRIAAGQSIANAARQTHREGLGSSPEANRKLWARQRQN